MINEQMKNRGYSLNYDMFMNLSQSMLAGRVLEEFFSEQWTQDNKNKTRRAKLQK
jgi:hypothetical protein